MRTVSCGVISANDAKKCEDWTGVQVLFAR